MFYIGVVDPFQTKAWDLSVTLIVLGSGGHTVEMLNVLSVLQKDLLSPRFYIAAATDDMSLRKARTYEHQLTHKTGAEVDKIAQFLGKQDNHISLLFSAMALVPVSPLCAIAFIFKVVGIRWSSIFYVESIARVKRLSLSGYILYKLHMADQFFVQWPQLHTKISCS